MTVLFVTNLVPPDRVRGFEALHARVPLELALFGGRSHHATAGVASLPVPHREVPQRAVLRLAASGRWDAVVCGTAGRVALPAAFAGARASRTPFVLWSALWADLRTPTHRLARPLMDRIHRDADAVVTYGEHVSAFAHAKGARAVFEAPQAVDGSFWSARVGAAKPHGSVRFGFVGRPVGEKGLGELLSAWRELGDGPPASLVVAGHHPHTPPAGDREAPPARNAGGASRATSVEHAGPLDAEGMRNFYGALDVLVVPSIPAPHFREPWGLVVNEAMHQGLPVIATDAVGAAAGGLVRHERNGLVVPAGDVGALRDAIARLRDDAELRARLGAAARRDVAAFTPDAWAAGFAAALRTVTDRRSLYRAP